MSWESRRKLHLWIRLEALPGIGNKNIKKKNSPQSRKASTIRWKKKLLQLKVITNKHRSSAFESIQVDRIDYGIMHKSCLKAKSEWESASTTKPSSKGIRFWIEGKKNRKQRRKKIHCDCVCVCAGKIERKRKARKFPHHIFSEIMVSHHGTHCRRSSCNVWWLIFAVKTGGFMVFWLCFTLSASIVACSIERSHQDNYIAYDARAWNDKRWLCGLDLKWSGIDVD